MSIASFVKQRRKQLRLTQPELAMRAGVGLRFVRELEQGKKTLRLDKVNQVLALFGAEVGVVTLVEEWNKQWIERSFLSNEMKEQYAHLLICKFTNLLIDLKD